MKSKHKLFLIKFFISISGILFVISLVMLYILERASKLDPNYQLYENRAIACLCLFAVSTIIMCLLMDFMKITPERVKSTKLKIKYRDYDKIKEWIEQQLKKDGYGEIGEYNEYPYKIRYTYQRSADIVYLVMIIREEEKI